MTTALATTARNPQQCFDGYIALVGRLHGELGVNITYMPLGDKLGAWDGPTLTVLINENAALEDQAWFLNQAWWYLVYGTSAIDEAAVREPRLVLVPTPRVSFANLA